MLAVRIAVAVVLLLVTADVGMAHHPSSIVEPHSTYHSGAPTLLKAFYEFALEWVDLNTALARAVSMTYLGLQGHLVTMTSAAEYYFVNNLSFS
jgi:hypothetical protein